MIHKHTPPEMVVTYSTTHLSGNRWPILHMPIQQFLGFWKQTNVYDYLLNSSLAYQSKIECYWRRNDVNYITVRKSAYVFHTGKPLDLFTETSFSGNEFASNAEYAL